MSMYDAVMLFGCVVVLGIIVKGFRSATRVKPIEQPDNWQSLGDRPHGGS